MKNKDWVGNKNSVYKTLGASNHTEKERQSQDYYATDPLAIDKLLTVENPSHFIYECACGEGHLSERLKQKGYEVFSSDIVDRNYDNAVIKDFFEVNKLDSSYDILTNPPYKFAKEFVLHSLELLTEGKKCYMFLKLTFLEGKTRYKELFSKYPPKTIHVFSERILCAKNGNFKEMRDSGGSAVCFAWFVWEKGYKGITQINWI